MKKCVSFFAAATAAVLLTVAPLHAQSKNFAVNLFGQYAPFISGEAGDGDGAPEYSDAFENGLGMGVEASYRLHDQFSILAGIGYERYDGEKYEGVSFEDLSLIPVYVGAKLHFGKRDARIDPYLRADMGLVHFDSVEVSYLGVSEKYWDSSWEPMFDVGLGLEYRFDSFGVFAEVKARYMSRPDNALGDYSQAGPSWTVPFCMGVSWQF